MTEQIAPKRNLKPFWILLALSGLPYILSWMYFAYSDRLPQLQSNNRGQLIEPARPVENLTLELVDGKNLATDSLKGSWTLLSAGSSSCDEACLKNVYYMRQVRRLMGEDRQRIKRLFVLLDGNDVTGFKAKVARYGEMQLIAGPTTDNQTLVNAMTINGISPENRIFIIDPMANLMMVYNKDDNPEDMAKDFRRLLQVVRIGQPKTAG